jgi:hypothetical protein
MVAPLPGERHRPGCLLWHFARQALSDAEAQVGLEMVTMATDDHREALRALSEKRPPVFTHGRR